MAVAPLSHSARDYVRAFEISPALPYGVTVASAFPAIPRVLNKPGGVLRRPPASLGRANASILIPAEDRWNPLEFTTAPEYVPGVWDGPHCGVRLVQAFKNSIPEAGTARTAL
jgi:hypothetical protein